MGFKVGDRVVYLGGAQDPLILEPPIKTETLTIERGCNSCADCGHYRLEEYPKDKVGGDQVFHFSQLRKVEPFKSNSHSRKLAKQAMQEIKTPEKLRFKPKREKVESN